MQCNAIEVTLRLCDSRVPYITTSVLFNNLGGSIHFDDINYDTRMYVSMLAYSQSKLANVLFAKELSRRLEGKRYLPNNGRSREKISNAHICTGTGVHVYSLHPGIVRTELTRTVDKVFFPGAWFLFRFFVYPWVKNPEQGAQTTLHCSIDEKAGEQTGLYYRLDNFLIVFLIILFECTTVFFFLIFLATAR